MDRARLVTRGLRVEVGTLTVCRDLDLDIDTGQNWAILGANGSGKTTLLLTLAGLRPPAAGGIRLDDRPVQDWPRRERARRIGVLFQDQDESLPANVLETVLAGRHPHLSRWQWESDHDRDLALTALAGVDLAGFEQRRTDTLSGGERRRTDIAMLLTQNPPLCLLDEPVNHLDPRHGIAVLDMFNRRARRPGHANVMVLHDVNLALRYCSHGLLLYGDGNVEHGPLDSVIDRARLERLYQCRFDEYLRNGERAFLPGPDAAA